LIQEEVTDTQNKVPLLGDIPLLGALFRSENTTKSKQNLMVFMRPSILRNNKDASFVTHEKYNYLRGVESGAYNEEDGSFGLLDDAAPRLPPIEEIDRSGKSLGVDDAEDASEADGGWDESLDDDNEYL
jgi:general secretion pathway protein D